MVVQYLTRVYCQHGSHGVSTLVEASYCSLHVNIRKGFYFRVNSRDNKFIS